MRGEVRIEDGCTDAEGLKIEDGSLLLGKHMMSWHLEAQSKWWVPKAHGKGKSITINTQDRGWEIIIGPCDRAKEIDAIRAEEMVNNPCQFSLNIPVDPWQCLLEQLARCFGVKCTQSTMCRSSTLCVDHSDTLGLLDVQMFRNSFSQVSYKHVLQQFSCQVGHCVEEHAWFKPFEATIFWAELLAAGMLGTYISAKPMHLICSLLCLAHRVWGGAVMIHL